MKKRLLATLILVLIGVSGCKKADETQTLTAADIDNNAVSAELDSIDATTPAAECVRWVTESCPESCYVDGVERTGCFVTKELIERKLAEGASANDVSSEGITPLMMAWDVEAVNNLLAAGADVNVEAVQGDTALWHFLNDPVVLKVLIDAGANVNAMNDGCPPLNFCYNIESVKMLIAAGADVNAMDMRVNVTPLMKAKTFEHAKLLINAGADVNMVADGGYSPLINAVLAGNLDLVRLLIASGADVNTEMVEGETPLMLVDQLEIAKVLVEAGANLNALTEEKISVLNYITQSDRLSEQERQAVVDYLKSKGAK